MYSMHHACTTWECKQAFTYLLQAQGLQSSLEIQERFEDLFGDYKGTSPWTASFILVDLLFRFNTAVIVGLMTGG